MHSNLWIISTLQQQRDPIKTDSFIQSSYRCTLRRRMCCLYPFGFWAYGQCLVIKSNINQHQQLQYTVLDVLEFVSITFSTVRLLDLYCTYCMSICSQWNTLPIKLEDNRLWSIQELEWRIRMADTNREDACQHSQIWQNSKHFILISLNLQLMWSSFAKKVISCKPQRQF